VNHFFRVAPLRSFELFFFLHVSNRQQTGLHDFTKWDTQNRRSLLFKIQVQCGDRRSQPSCFSRKHETPQGGENRTPARILYSNLSIIGPARNARNDVYWNFVKMIVQEQTGIEHSLHSRLLLRVSRYVVDPLSQCFKIISRAPPVNVCERGASFFVGDHGKCKICLLPAFGACRAIETHSSITFLSTGFSRSSPLRTARVVAKSLSQANTWSSSKMKLSVFPAQIAGIRITWILGSR
jgi:hypothetical protein